ncbi:ferredoxin family protein [Cytobacillus sp. Hz8]|uniref:ferredoxin family protein n=1 Tax=Cytobacillus sp. Hz8 TaxID=3347168 RepID=UPI0035DDA354
MKRLSIEERLGTDKFLVDDELPHITLDKNICNTCADKPCVKACPAGLYVLQGNEVSFDYVGCLECGTCRVVCIPKGLKWEYPRSTFGIEYRFG